MGPIDVPLLAFFARVVVAEVPPMATQWAEYHHPNVETLFCIGDFSRQRRTACYQLSEACIDWPKDIKMRIINCMPM